MRKTNVRIAFREEGTMWNAYLALPDTMVNAKLIGSISFGAIARNPEIKKAFMDTMKMLLAEAVENVTGGSIDYWDERRAPEIERSGHS